MTHQLVRTSVCRHAPHGGYEERGHAVGAQQVLVCPPAYELVDHGKIPSVCGNVQAVKVLGVPLVEKLWFVIKNLFKDCQLTIFG